MHGILIMQFLDRFASLPHNLQYHLKVGSLIIGIHEVKQVALEIVVDEGTLIFAIVDMQSNTIASCKFGVQLLTLLVRVIRYSL
jgi:hypothetical protein